MLPDTCVVVPTYWTRAGGSPQPGDAVYDHPTPLNGESTLPALLDSLDKLDTASFYLLILVAVTGNDVASDAELRVTELVGRYRDMQSVVFGPSHLAWLHRWLSDNGQADATSYLDLRTYARVRNLQLAIPHAFHTSRTVALDDDEIVTDPLFLEKATEPLGTEIEGVKVDGLSGHYLQENGSILLNIDPDKAASPNLFDRKAAIMNAATEMLERHPGDIVQTPFCFGGNMEFTSELASAVGFDPGITRGEDIDYLINARMEGRHFFLRKDLNILHCPPKGGSYKDVSISKLLQDIVRFVYEQGKLKASQRDPALKAVTASDLMPYPGEFLAGDLREQCERALLEAGYEGDAAAYVQQAYDAVEPKVEDYLVFRRRWPEIMRSLHAADTVAEHLIEGAEGARSGI